MKKLIIAAAMLASVIGCDVSGNYLHFNRDALWNLSLVSNRYCTFDPSTITNGMIFCHVYDATTKNRIKHSQELTVLRVLQDNCYVVKIPYLHNGTPDSPLPLKPIVVKVLPTTKAFQEGDLFTAWGQYEIRGTANWIVKSDYRPVYYAVQINHKSSHVFDEPFIDYGQTDR